MQIRVNEWSSNMHVDQIIVAKQDRLKEFLEQKQYFLITVSSNICSYLGHFFGLSSKK